jgi:hypothetical protein
MRPHPQDFDFAFSTINLIHQTVLDVDAARIGAGKISNQFFVRRRTLKRIFRDDVEKSLRLRSKVCRCDLAGVLLCLPGVDDRPAHQPGLIEALLSGSAIPLRMEARIPGIESR